MYPILHWSQMAPSNLELQTQVPSENLLLVPSASQGLGEDVLKIEEVEVEVEVKVLVEVLKVLKEIVEAFGEIVEEDKDPFEVEDRIGNILEVDKDPFGVGVPEPMSKYEDGVGDILEVTNELLDVEVDSNTNTTNATNTIIRTRTMTSKMIL